MRGRISRFVRGNAKLLLVVGLVTVVTGATGAVAASKFINSKKIKNGTIKLVDLNPEVRSAIDTARAGTPGPPGANGQSAVFEAGNWGVIPRNTIGSPVGDLRPGPFGSFGVTGAQGAPPFGEGSLGIQVNDDDDGGAGGDDTEKVAFGNEVDFLGDPVLDLDEVGFHVFQTGENANISAANLPNITFEIDSNLVNPGTSPDYTSMVFVPVAQAFAGGGSWTGYIDATDGSEGEWYLTGSEGTNSGCSISNMCTFTELQTALGDGAPDPIIYTAAVSKGRDQEWVGAVDGFRINDDIFDFEPLGVEVQSP